MMILKSLPFNKKGIYMEKTVKKWVIISAIIFAIIMSFFICINSYAIATSQSGGQVTLLPEKLILMEN